MNSLPVIARELLVAGRRPGTYRVRIIAAAAAVLFTLAIFLFSDSFTRPGALSKQIFVTVSIFAFVCALLAGVFLTTDCICSERQEGTLPLLFLTRLNGFDVALGKLVSTSAVAGYALLAVMPVLGLPTLIGGVTGAEFARVCLVLMVTLMWSLTTGLLCSTLCRDVRCAMSTALGIVLLAGVFFGVTWALSTVSTRLAQLMVLTPSGAFLNAFDALHRTQTGAERYRISLGLLVLSTIAQFTAVSLLLRRCQSEAPVAVRKTHFSFRQARRRPIRGNPYLWLLLRERYPTPTVVALAGLLLLVFAISALAAIGGGMTPFRNMCLLVALLTAFTFNLLVKGLATIQASGHLSEQRRSGALELLLTTPLPPRFILDAHRTVLGRQNFALIVFGVLVNLGLIVAFLSVVHAGNEAALLYPTVFLGGAILLPVDCSALRWIAMHEALAGNRHHHAVLNALLRVFPLAWILFALGITGLAGARSSAATVAIFYLIWAIVCGVLTAATGKNRALLLQHNFRTIAAANGWASTRPGFRRRIFSATAAPHHFARP